VDSSRAFLTLQLTGGHAMLRGSGAAASTDDAVKVREIGCGHRAKSFHAHQKPLPDGHFR
jgi:hypothetical protein